MAYKFGTLKHNPNNQSQPYTGEIKSPVFSGKVTLQPVPTRRSDDAPHFEIFSGGFQVGNTWIKQTRNGADFLTMTLDGPDFVAPLYLTAFEREGEPGVYDATWQRPRQDRKGQAVDTAQTDAAAAA